MMKKLFENTVLFIFLSIFMVSNIAANQKCNINDFKSLYIELQRSLNYEGKDAEFNKTTGAINLVNHHNPNDPDTYGGKVYERVLQKQYTSALRKVALLYRHSEKAPDERKPEEIEVVNFFKSIDDPSKYPLNDFNKFTKLVTELQKSSKKAFSDKPHSQINDQDVYLLQKLLIHAYDTICRTQNYILKKNQTADNKKAASISIEKALSMMTESFRKNVKELDTSDEIVEIKLAAREATVNQAVNDNLNQLRAWLKDPANVACVNRARNLEGFNNFQPCNYRKFMDSMLVDDKEFKSYEAILHFINANQKHGKINPKAETGLSADFKLQLIGIKPVKECKKDEQLDANNNCVKTPPPVKPIGPKEGDQCKKEEDRSKGYKIEKWLFIAINTPAVSPDIPGNPDNSAPNLQCACNGNECCNEGFSLDKNECKPNTPPETPNEAPRANPTDEVCDPKPIGIIESLWIKKDQSCVCKNEDGKGCCLDGYEFKGSSCEKKLEFDFVKDCDPAKHIKDKSIPEKKCVDKKPETPTDTTAKKCTSFPEGADENAWSLNAAGACVCAAESDSCCLAGFSAESNKSYEYKNGKCEVKSLGGNKPKAEEEEERDPIFSREIKNAPSNFQPIILREDQIMIMPGQR